MDRPDIQPKVRSPRDRPVTAVERSDAAARSALFDPTLVGLSHRPDPRRLGASLYPLRYGSTLRFADLDTLGHLNNVAHSALHEDGRTVLCERVFPEAERPRRNRHIVAQNSLHFLAEAYYPGELLVCAGIGRIGRTSYVTSTALFSALEPRPKELQPMPCVLSPSLR